MQKSLETQSDIRKCSQKCPVLTLSPTKSIFPPQSDPHLPLSAYRLNTGLQHLALPYPRSVAGLLPVHSYLGQSLSNPPTLKLVAISTSWGNPLLPMCLDACSTQPSLGLSPHSPHGPVPQLKAAKAG